MRHMLHEYGFSSRIQGKESQSQQSYSWRCYVEWPMQADGLCSQGHIYWKMLANAWRSPSVLVLTPSPLLLTEWN
jgi:hypothetical protein